MKYYLPINSSSLAHYFVCACVKPAYYFENKPQDIQDRFRNALLLSTELGTKDTDCCIELVVTKAEETLLVPCSKSFYLFPVPLPISRIKKIYFQDQRQLELTLSNINLSAAFVPHSLAAVTRFSSAGYEGNHFDDKTVGKDFSHQIELFDRVLGALALMKTAKEPYMNYSENYASTLSFFNALVKDDLERQGLQINDKYFGLFSRSGSFIKFIPYLERKISKEDLDQIAADNKQRIERSFTKAINFDKLSGMPYTFAVLQSFGVGGEAAPKKIDSLISTNFEEIKDDKAEGIALCYGYNRGYSIFSNSYGTEETRRQTVKYLLDSQLDYYTIESVYQFAFYSNAASTHFPYLDDWCPKKNQRPKRKTDYMVLDTAFIGKKRSSVFSKEYLIGFLAEIKTFDFITTPIGSLVEHIRDSVANDTKEEVEDVAETKIAEAYTIIETLKGQIASQDGIISDLQKRNESLVKEIASLKTTACQYPTKVEERAGLLQEPEVKYGTESIAGEPNDLPGDDMPLGDTSIVVNGYSSSKKGGRTTKAKTGSTKSKATSKPSKKATNKVSGDEHNNGVTETQAPAQDIVSKTSSDNGGNPTLFD